MPHPSLLFLHGSGDSARCWDEVIQRLGPAANGAVALDLPGHGARAHEPPPQPPTVAAYVAAVLADLQSRALERTIVVGHSLGGAIALQLALTAPQRIAGLVLVGSGARLRVLPALLDRARTDPEAVHRQLVEMGHAPDHAALAARYVEGAQPVAPGALLNDLTACDTFDVMAELPAIHQPALILVGNADRLTPPKYATHLASQMPSATLAVIPGAGHYLMDEAPGELARELAAWLARLEISQALYQEISPP